MAEKTVVTPNYVKKITVSTVGLDTKQLEEIASENKGNIPVVRVFGRVDSMENGQSQFNSFIRFRGEMEAVNLIDGTIWRSRATILPEIAEQNLQDIVSKADEGASIDFALDITVSYYDSTKGGNKFRYGVTTVLDSGKAEDPLAKMRASLPAPKIPGGKKK